MSFLQCAKLLKAGLGWEEGAGHSCRAIFTDQICVRLRSAVAIPWKPTERQTQMQAPESPVRKVYGVLGTSFIQKRELKIAGLSPGTGG